MTLKRENVLKDFESFAFQKMANSSILGLSIAMIKDGRIDYQRGFGFRDFIKGTSATPKTTYCTGSVTKSFTALAVLQLYEKGLLSLDDPVEKHIPFKAKALGEQILIKHLLSHSSGLAALGYAEATLSAVTDIADVWLPIASPEDLLLFVSGAEDWAHSRPGLRYAYLNEGYILLGSIIEKISGEKYHDYVRDHILKPLGMSRSTFLEEDVDEDNDVATPYITSQDGERVSTRYPYGQMISDGGLMSNAIDLARFIQMLISGGAYEGTLIAEPSTIADMITPKIRTTEEPIDGKSFTHYGYGIRIRSDFFGHDLVYHSGSVFGSSAYIGLIPDMKAGIAILSNGGYFLEDLGEYALARILGEDHNEISYFKRTNLLDSLTGSYKTFRNTASYKVTRNGGILQLETSFWQRSWTTPLIPVDIDGETKRFKVYSVESTTPVEFVKRNSDTYMIYERNMAKKIGSIQ